jgi:hypothetical protein
MMSAFLSAGSRAPAPASPPKSTNPLLTAVNELISKLNVRDNPPPSSAAAANESKKRKREEEEEEDSDEEEESDEDAGEELGSNTLAQLSNVSRITAALTVKKLVSGHRDRKPGSSYPPATTNDRSCWIGQKGTNRKVSFLKN